MVSDRGSILFLILVWLYSGCLLVRLDDYGPRATTIATAWVAVWLKLSDQESNPSMLARFWAAP